MPNELWAAFLRRCLVDRPLNFKTEFVSYILFSSVDSVALLSTSPAFKMPSADFVLRSKSFSSPRSLHVWNTRSCCRGDARRRLWCWFGGAEAGYGRCCFSNSSKSYVQLKDCRKSMDPLCWTCDKWLVTQQVKFTGAAVLYNFEPETAQLGH